MFATALALISQVTPDRESRVKALAAYGAAIGASFALLALPTAMMWTSLAALATQAVAGARGASVSVMYAAKFAGLALAPIVLVPVYVREGALIAFGAAGACSLLGLVPLEAYRRRAARE